MGQKFILGMMLVVIATFQSGCKSFPLRQVRSARVVDGQPDLPVEPNQVFLGGAVISRTPITIPNKGLSLLQVISQAGIKTNVDSEGDGDLSSYSEMMVSMRRESRTGYQLYYFPLRYVLYGSAGEISVKNADTVQIVSIDSLPAPQANALPCIIAGLVEAPGQYQVDNNANRLDEIDNANYTSPLADAMTVTITRRGAGIGAVESYVIPLTEADLLAGLEIVGGDVIKFTQDAGVPILISSYLDKLKRNSRVVETAPNTVRNLRRTQTETDRPFQPGMDIPDRFKAVAARTRQLFRR